MNDTITKVADKTVTESFFKNLDTLAGFKGVEAEKERIADMKKMILDTEVFSNDDELVEYIEQAVKDVKAKDIKVMNAEKFDETFRFKDSPVRLGEDDDFEFTKDSFVYMAEMHEAEEEIDRLTKQLAEDTKKAQEEIDSIIAEYGSYDTIMRNRMKAEIEAMPEGPGKKNAVKMLDYYNDTFQLNILESWVAKEPMDIWEDLLTDKDRGNLLFNRFEKASQKYHLAISMSSVNRYLGLEDKFLPEKYKDVTNMFLLIWIYYASLLRDGRHYAPERMYLITIGVRLKHLMLGASIFGEGEKERFITSIQRVLDSLDIERLSKANKEAEAKYKKENLGIETTQEQEEVTEE